MSIKALLFFVDPVDTDDARRNLYAFIQTLDHWGRIQDFLVPRNKHHPTREGEVPPVQWFLEGRNHRIDKVVDMGTYWSRELLGERDFIVLPDENALWKFITEYAPRNGCRASLSWDNENKIAEMEISSL